MYAAPVTSAETTTEVDVEELPSIAATLPSEPSSANGVGTAVDSTVGKSAATGTTEGTSDVVVEGGSESISTRQLQTKRTYAKRLVLRHRHVLCIPLPPRRLLSVHIRTHKHYLPDGKVEGTKLGASEGTKLGASLGAELGTKLGASDATYPSRIVMSIFSQESGSCPIAKLDAHSDSVSSLTAVKTFLMVPTIQSLLKSAPASVWDRNVKINCDESIFTCAPKPAGPQPAMNRARYCSEHRQRVFP